MYTVTFDAKNGEPLFASFFVAHGDTVPRPADPTREDYTFIGWYKYDTDDTDSINNPCLSVAQLAPSACQWDFSADRITSDSTLYALWIEDIKLTYTVTFNARGGSFAPDTLILEQIVERDSLAKEPVVPTRYGYTFEGWYEDSIEWSEKWNFETPITGDITLYAKWGPRFYTVTFNSRGGSHIFEQAVEHGSTVLRPLDPIRPKYTFEGWYADHHFSAMRTFNEDREESDSTLWNFSTNRITCDTTLYAKWTLHELFVTFITPNDDGINDCLEISQKFLNYPNEMSVFNRAGYVVYNKKGYDNKFCGVNLPNGTYFYLFTYTDDNGKKQKIFNSILITRE
jgi:uncharacterized repeat protein (TIGR02543 family)/gliding motility-associated-like protein